MSRLTFKQHLIFWTIAVPYSFGLILLVVLKLANTI